MHLDSNGLIISENDFVKLIEPDTEWFNYLDTDSYSILQEACNKPIKVEYLEDNGWLSLILPATIAEDGEYVSNSINVLSTDVILVKSTI